MSHNYSATFSAITTKQLLKLDDKRSLIYDYIIKTMISHGLVLLRNRQQQQQQQKCHKLWMCRRIRIEIEKRQTLILGTVYGRAYDRHQPGSGSYSRMMGIGRNWKTKNETVGTILIAAVHLRPIKLCLASLIVQNTMHHRRAREQFVIFRMLIVWE